MENDSMKTENLAVPRAESKAAPALPAAPTVESWTLSESAMRNYCQVTPRFKGEQEVVRKSDYDALKAERDALEKSEWKVIDNIRVTESCKSHGDNVCVFYVGAECPLCNALDGRHALLLANQATTKVNQILTGTLDELLGGRDLTVLTEGKTNER